MDAMLSLERLPDPEYVRREAAQEAAALAEFEIQDTAELAAVEVRFSEISQWHKEFTKAKADAKRPFKRAYDEKMAELDKFFDMIPNLATAKAGLKQAIETYRNKAAHERRLAEKAAEAAYVAGDLQQMTQMKTRESEAMLPKSASGATTTVRRSVTTVHAPADAIQAAAALVVAGHPVPPYMNDPLRRWAAELAKQGVELGGTTTEVIETVRGK